MQIMIKLSKDHKSVLHDECMPILVSTVRQLGSMLTETITFLNQSKIFIEFLLVRMPITYYHTKLALSFIGI